MSKLKISEIKSRVSQIPQEQLADFIASFYSLSDEGIQRHIMEWLDEHAPNYETPKRKKNGNTRNSISKVTSIVAQKAWLEIPKQFRERLSRNVYCSGCRDTCTIVDYTITMEQKQLVLEGQCKSCGHDVARVID